MHDLRGTQWPRLVTSGLRAEAVTTADPFGPAVKVLRTRSRLRSHERWSAEEIRAHQDRALADLRAYAMQHSRFYQRFHRGLEHAPLRELPVLEKRELMDSFDELVTDPGGAADTVATSAIDDAATVFEPPDEQVALNALLHVLSSGKTCADRRAVIPKLVELGDPAATPSLKAARYRMRGGLLGIGSSNSNACLKKTAEAAIKTLTK